METINISAGLYVMETAEETNIPSSKFQGRRAGVAIRPSSQGSRYHQPDTGHRHMLSEDSDASNSPGVEPSHQSRATPGHPGNATSFSTKAAYIKEAMRAIEGHYGRNESAAGHASYCW